MKSALLARRDIQIDAVWDLETETWDQFVFGGLLHRNGDYEDYDWRDESKFVDKLLGIRGTIWAHFGGGFDFKWYLDRIGPMGKRAQITRAASRIVSIDIGHQKVCDSYALAPMALEDFTKGLGEEKEELALPCGPDVDDSCHRGCGGYCQIKRGMTGWKYERVRAYMKKDCVSLRNSLLHLRDFARENDLDLGQTIGSSAWRNARRFVGLTSANPDKGGLPVAKYKFARKSYHGGRTQLYRKCVRVLKRPWVRETFATSGFRESHIGEHADWEKRELLKRKTVPLYSQPVIYERPIPAGHELDVNSMYPWALKTFAVPFGHHESVWGRESVEALVKERPGLYRCRVHVPEMLLPPLPARYKNGTATAYPTGDFIGTWPLPELQWAIERGCTIQPLEALVWEGERHLFRDWIGKLWQLRDKAGPKTPMGVWLKLYMNSLTGKFGSNPEKEQYFLNPKQVRFCECECRACGMILRRCRCPIENYNPPDHCPCNPMTQRTDHVWSVPIYKIEDCAYVQFAAYLTSYSRVHLNRGQVSDGHDGATIVMSDTDSLHSEGDEILNILKKMGLVGKELGQFKHEGPWRDFIGIAPKVYSYICACGKDPCARRPKDDPGPCLDTLVSNAKGITLPKSMESGKPTERPLVGKFYAKEGIIGLGRGLSEGKFFKRAMTRRRLLPRCGDRVVEDDHFHTRPPQAKELNLDEGWELLPEEQEAA